MFSDCEKLVRLNKITHKHILAKVRDLIAEYKKSGHRGVIVDAPLLFESGFDAECDTTICVCADKSARLERIVLRDSISCDKAMVRINSQVSDDELRRKCDYTIENNSTPEDLRMQVTEIARQIFDY